MEGRQGRPFTDDYKRQAVDLVASSGRSIGSVAKITSRSWPIANLSVGIQVPLRKAD
jgi:hypothetical protein